MVFIVSVGGIFLMGILFNSLFYCLYHIVFVSVKVHKVSVAPLTPWKILEFRTPFQGLLKLFEKRIFP